MRKPAKSVAVSSYLRHIENYLSRFSDVYNNTMDIIEERHSLQNEFDLKVIEKFWQISKIESINMGLGIMWVIGVIVLALIQYGII